MVMKLLLDCSQCRSVPWWFLGCSWLSDPISCQLRGGSLGLLPGRGAGAPSLMRTRTCDVHWEATVPAVAHHDHQQEAQRPFGTFSTSGLIIYYSILYAFYIYSLLLFILLVVVKHFVQDLLFFLLYNPSRRTRCRAEVKSCNFYFGLFLSITFPETCMFHA